MNRQELYKAPSNFLEKRNVISLYKLHHRSKDEVSMNVL